MSVSPAHPFPAKAERPVAREVMAWVTSPSGQGWLLGLLYLLLGMRLVADSRNIHDEGLQIFGAARSLGIAFIPCFFFQRVKPVLAMFYFLPAQISFGVYAAMHVVAGAAGVVWISKVTTALGHRRPWLPPLCLALSPMYVWCGATGISNSDGVVAIALALYLLEVRRSYFALGLLLGALPWVRFECATFSALAAVYVLWRERRVRFLLALAAWPALYFVAGALYHHSLRWPLEYQPTVSALASIHGSEAATFASHDARTAIEALLMVSPAMALVSFCRWRRLAPLERILLVFLSVHFGLFVATHFRPLPLGPAFVLGFASRNALVPAAAAAILISRAVEELLDDREAHTRNIATLALLLLVAAWARQIGAGTTLLYTVAALGLAMTLARANAQRYGAAAITLLVALAPFGLVQAMARGGYTPEALRTQRRLDEATSALDALGPDALRPGVYTNNHTLGAYLSRVGRFPGVRVHFMLPRDHETEIRTLTNPRNGQREAVARALPLGTYGDVITEDELQPDRMPAGSIFVLIADSRTEMIFPRAVWAPHLRIVRTSPGLEVAELIHTSQ